MKKQNFQSPYAAANFTYGITKIYREAYGIFESNGILFNHSPKEVKLLTQKNNNGSNKNSKKRAKITLLGNLML